MNRWVWLCSLLLLVPGGLKAQVTKQSCVALYKALQRAKAARCFAQLAGQMGASAGLSKTQKEAKGRLLRNAALLYIKAAKASRKLERASYLRSRAAVLLQAYVDEGLYESIARKRSAMLLMLRTKSDVGLSNLTLVIPRQDATLEISGYKHKSQHRGNWSGKLRPGAYRIQVKVPGRSRPVTREVHLLPNSARVVTVEWAAPVPIRRRPAPIRRRPAPIRRRPAPIRVAKRVPVRPIPSTPNQGLRVTSFVLMGVGIAGVLAGVGVLIYTETGPVAAFHDLEERLEQNPSAVSPEDTKESAGFAAQAQTLIPVGWIVGGAGLALLVTGGVLFAVSGKGGPPRTALVPSPPRGQGFAALPTPSVRPFWAFWPSPSASQPPTQHKKP